MTYQPKAPAIIDSQMYGIEDRYTQLGRDGFAKLMATRLRDPRPRREVLDAIARLLDPHPDDDLALIVVRRSKGNPKMRWTKRNEDIEIAREVLHFEEEWLRSGKKGRGLRKKAIGDIVERRGISEHKVRQALKILPLIPKVIR
jgi:hypothetical protein